MKKTLSTLVARIVAYLMLLSAWLSFVVAAWLSICYQLQEYVLGAFLWLVLTVILALILASEHK